jgi:hypothetical protein
MQYSMLNLACSPVFGRWWISVLSICRLVPTDAHAVFDWRVLERISGPFNAQYRRADFDVQACRAISRIATCGGCTTRVVVGLRPQGPKNGTQKLGGPVHPGSHVERCADGAGGAAGVLHAQTCSNTPAVSSNLIARGGPRLFCGKGSRKAREWCGLSFAMVALLAGRHRMMR